MTTPYTLPDIDISFGSQGDTQFSVMEAPFGDGYIQREEEGLNSKQTLWNITWKGLPDTDVLTLTDFFDARGGVEAFNWTPPGESTSRQWRVLSYNRIPTGYLNKTLNATFQEMFDP